MRGCWSRVKNGISAGPWRQRDSDELDRAVLEQFHWVLRWLASDPEKALSAVPEPWMAPDEIANDFDDRFEASLSGGLLPAEAIGTLRAIDHRLEQMTDSGEEMLWSPEGFLHDARWEDLRELARTALGIMGIARADDQLQGRV